MMWKNLNFIDYAFLFFNKKIVRFLKKIKYNIYKKKIISYSDNLNFVYGIEKTIISVPQIFISLTSYKPRFETLLLCLKSLLNQDLKPNGIFVWLDCEQKDLPESLKKLEKYGITYVYNCENIKPHKKYFYAMKKFPNDIIITVDDDAIYPKNLVSGLYKTYLKYPNCICARRVHKITRKMNGELFSYCNWKFNYTKSKKPSYDLIATGIGGILYPPKILHPDTFNIKNIKKNCLEADDIWLKFYENLNNKKVVWSPCKCPEPAEIKDSQIVSLNFYNIEHNGNDKYIKVMERELNICIDMKNKYLKY